MSAECTRRIVGVDGAVKALCNRLVVVELNNRTSRDLAEQCVKVSIVHWPFCTLENKKSVLLKQDVFNIHNTLVSVV